MQRLMWRSFCLLAVLNRLSGYHRASQLLCSFRSEWTIGTCVWLMKILACLLFRAWIIFLAPVQMHESLNWRHWLGSTWCVIGTKPGVHCKFVDTVTVILAHVIRCMIGIKGALSNFSGTWFCSEVLILSQVQEQIWCMLQCSRL